MNWFSFIKLAQLWETEEDDTFLGHATSLYELEYKYSTLKNNLFIGNPQRKQKIMERIEEEIRYHAEELLDPMMKLFKGWLKSHALTNPKQWAQERILPSGYDDIHEYCEMSGEKLESLLYGLAFEYLRVSGYDMSQRISPENIFLKMLNEATRKGIKLESLNKIIEEILLQDRKELMYADLAEDGLKEFGEMNGREFCTIEEAEEYIDSITIDDFSYIDILDYYPIETLVTIAYNYGYYDDILAELYEKFVFPLWYKKWASQGIDQTREIVENTYASLIELEKRIDDVDVGKITSTINYALNVQHQNGSLLEYLEDVLQEDEIGYPQFTNNIFDELEALSQGVGVDEWNKELRMVGVRIE